LQEYEFDIKHKSGSCHPDADCLSRSLPNDATTEDTSSNEYDEDNIPVHNEFSPSRTTIDTSISQINAVQTRAQKAALNNSPSTSTLCPPTITSTILSPITTSVEPHIPSLIPGFDYTKIPQGQETDPIAQQRISEMQQYPNTHSAFVV
ncbi:unnamed protein product, partial [Didymodactylos carnosus]